MDLLKVNIHFGRFQCGTDSSQQALSALIPLELLNFQVKNV